jgi:hypothetical protein
MNSCYRDTKKLCSTFRFILCKFEVIHNNVHGKNGLRHVDGEIIDVGEYVKRLSVFILYTRDYHPATGCRVSKVEERDQIYSVYFILT